MSDAEDLRCTLCQQNHCDLRVKNCGCVLHAVCLPTDILFNPNLINKCPSCRKAPFSQIIVLPLPVHFMEKKSRLHLIDSEYACIKNEELGFEVCEQTFQSTDIDKKGQFSSVSTTSRIFRTGHWTNEESNFVNNLIKQFDDGILPLPDGIKLNDFLCELLLCRKSRLTKKLKHAKLSSRSFRSTRSNLNIIDSNQTMSESVSRVTSVQWLQTLFLKTVNPTWLRMEVQLNISMMWRRHLVNLCLQIGFSQLDTKDWNACLGFAHQLSSEESNLEARRKRIKYAMSEDVVITGTSTTTEMSTENARNIQYKEISSNYDCGGGVFIGQLRLKSLLDADLEHIDDVQSGCSIDTSFNEYANCKFSEEKCDSINGEKSTEKNIMMKAGKRMSLEPLELQNTLKHVSSVSSFSEFLTPLTACATSRRTSRIESFSLDDTSHLVADVEEGENKVRHQLGEKLGPDVHSVIDDAIESVIETHIKEPEYQGRFLCKVAQFLTDRRSEFQHVDLWVPIELSHQVITSSNNKSHCTLMQTDNRLSPVRLSHAGCITVKAHVPTQIVNRLNEFGMYSKSFSFSPGFGLPGRVYLSREPSWESNVSLARPDQFERVGGAKVYGINTALGIPVKASIGIMIVVLYSTSFLPKDPVWVNECTNLFHKLSPIPRWRLSIETASSVFEKLNSAQDSSESYQESVQTMFQPDAESLFSLIERSLTLLLGKYVPIECDISTDDIRQGSEDLASHLVSLRLLLLRHLSYRTADESNFVSTILNKYRRYVQSHCKEHDIVQLIVNDWRCLSSTGRILTKDDSLTLEIVESRYSVSSSSNYPQHPTAATTLNPSSTEAPLNPASQVVFEQSMPMTSRNQVPRIVSEKKIANMD